MRPILAAAAMLAMVGGSAATERLTLLTWDHYISPRVSEAWNSETGTELNIVTFSSRAERDAILSLNHGAIDLAVVNESVLKPLVDAWRVVEVSERTVPTVVHSEPRFRQMCTGFGLPYSWGTLGIAYRADRMPRPQSWSDLLNPAEHVKGRIAMMRGEDELLAPPLFMLGRRVDTPSDLDLQAAMEILRAQAPAVASYDYALSDLADPATISRFDMVLAYSGDEVALARTDGGVWRYVLPSEGSLVWVDCVVVLAASDRRNLALRFLDFLGRPAIAAINASDLSHATTNAAALDLLKSDGQTPTDIHPPTDRLDRSRAYPRLTPRALVTRKRALAAFLADGAGVSQGTRNASQ